MFTKLRNNISQMQMIALGFFCIILIGTLLLMTPLASRAGTWTDFLTALLHLPVLPASPVWSLQILIYTGRFLVRSSLLL